MEEPRTGTAPDFRVAEYARALPYLRPYAGSLTLIILASLVATGTGLISPLMNQWLIDEGLLGRNFRVLCIAAAAMAGLTAFGFVLNAWSSYTYVRVSARVLFEMRLELYRHLQRVAPRYHAKARMGDLISRLSNDVAEVQRVSADVLLALLANVVFLVGAVFLMLRISPLLFLVSIALIPLSLWLTRIAQHRLARHVKRLRERSASIGSFLIESLTGLRLTVLSNAQEREAERFRDENSCFISALMSMQLANFLAGAIPTGATTLSTSAVFLVGGSQVLSGELTLGALVAFLAYHGRLLSPVQNLMSLYGSLVTGAVSLRRMFEVLEVPIEVEEPPDPVRVERWRGEVEFRGVEFDYCGQPVLRGVDLRLEPGQTFILTGPSGAGKSTLADLLVRLCDPTAGSIRLDGHDLRSISLADLRHQIAVVEQTPVLFHGTIRDNIAYARPGASGEDLARAAHEASLTLPLDTMVGERGTALSAGERQRIAIARMLLRDPRVVVLDEPVSALDSATRASIRETLAHALQGRTALVITHDPGVADGELLHLEHGVIGRVCQPA